VRFIHILHASAEYFVVLNNKKLSYRRDSARCGWCGLSKHKVTLVLKCTVWSQCTLLPNRRYWRTVKRPLKVTRGHPLLCQLTRHTWLTISTQ